MEQDKAQDLASLATQRPWWRHLMLALALLMAVGIYKYVVDIYDPNKNLLTQLYLGITQESYQFHSGAEGGFYIRVGEAIQRETSGWSPIAVSNQPSGGGLDNAKRVMKYNRSFGLVQEDSVASSDFIRDHIAYITPLYVERMHIIYSREAWEKHLREVGGNQKSGGESAVEYHKPVIRRSGLSEDPRPQAIRSFFRSHSISMGPVGSGSGVLAQYVLDHCGISPGVNLRMDFKEALNSLGTADGPSVVFTIAGAPLPEVTKKLAERDGVSGERKFALMSIDPPIIPEINRKYTLRLRSTSFKNVYDGGANVTTLGSYAFLIASKDVPKSATMALLDALDRAKTQMRTELDVGAKDFPLDEFPFAQSFKKQYDGFLVDLLKSALIFIVSVSLSSAAIMTFIGWATSGLRNVSFYREIQKIYDAIPKNTRLEQGDLPFAVPKIYSNQTMFIDAIVKGMRDMLTIGARVRKAYEVGGLIVSHQQHLLATLTRLSGVLQRNLHQRLDAFIKMGGSIDPSVLQRFHTAGYLTTEHRESLSQSLQVAAKPKRASRKPRKSTRKAGS